MQGGCRTEIKNFPGGRGCVQAKGTRKVLSERHEPGKKRTLKICGFSFLCACASVFWSYIKNIALQNGTNDAGGRAKGGGFDQVHDSRRETQPEASHPGPDVANALQENREGCGREALCSQCTSSKSLLLLIPVLLFVLLLIVIIFILSLFLLL